MLKARNPHPRKTQCGVVIDSMCNAKMCSLACQRAPEKSLHIDKGPFIYTSLCSFSILFSVPLHFCSLGLQGACLTVHFLKKLELRELTKEMTQECMHKMELVIRPIAPQMVARTIDRGKENSDCC